MNPQQVRDLAALAEAGGSVDIPVKATRPIQGRKKFRLVGKPADKLTLVSRTPLNGVCKRHAIVILPGNGEAPRNLDILRDLRLDV